jgi:hypothetical protein
MLLGGGAVGGEGIWEIGGWGGRVRMWCAIYGFCGEERPLVSGG